MRGGVADSDTIVDRGADEVIERLAGFDITGGDGELDILDDVPSAGQCIFDTYTPSPRGRVAWHSSDGLDGTVSGAKIGQNGTRKWR